MSRCSGSVVKCTDKTCYQYNRHHTCESHQLHIGDIICQKDTGWIGYIYDANPWGSKRSVHVNWEGSHFDEGAKRTGKLFVGHAACTKIDKINAPRKPKSMVSKK